MGYITGGDRLLASASRPITVEDQAALCVNVPTASAEDGLFPPGSSTRTLLPNGRCSAAATAMGGCRWTSASPPCSSANSENRAASVRSGTTASTRSIRASGICPMRAFSEVEVAVGRAVRGNRQVQAGADHDTVGGGERARPAGPTDLAARSTCTSFGHLRATRPSTNSTGSVACDCAGHREAGDQRKPTVGLQRPKLGRSEHRHRQCLPSGGATHTRSSLPLPAVWLAVATTER
jgi:hypothetical protein